MPNYDASSQNEKRSSRVYKDLNLNFTRNPVTGDVATVTDVNAVKRSIRNLVLLNSFEKPFHPEIASGVRDMLFELMTPDTAALLARQVQDIIENFEPRARLTGVRAIPDYDRNSYSVTVEFYVVNTPTELVDLTIFLERLR